MSTFAMSNKENSSAQSYNSNKRNTFHASTSSSGKTRNSLMRKILRRRRTSDPMTRKYKKKGLIDGEEDLGSELLSSFSKTSEAPVFGNFVKSTTVLQTMTNPETGEHMGFLKEVMPGKAELSEPRMTLHQRNVWQDGWLMEAHFSFKNYTEQQVTVALKFLHVHDNLEFLKYGDDSVKVEADKRYTFPVFALQGDVDQFVVRRKERIGNPKMLEISYRFGYKKNGRWNMTW